MNNIYRFPNTKRTVSTQVNIIKNDIKRDFLGSTIKVIWVATVLVWPFLKWVISIDVFFKLVKTFYYWNTPGIYAGWEFAMHFAVLTALTFFVSIYKPKGL